jgi:chromosome segregation protein
MVLLKRLDIFGFKSFPIRTRFEFNEGVTAFVGPNGCGKTNVVDSIRWVLGEHNARGIRCERMEDVIFNGSAGRKPLGMGEVSLTLDNDGALPIEMPEVKVTRRVYRSGESEYFINGASCRHRDVADLFLDTGLSPRTYSVFEREMIDQILSADPTARRAFFEEAAGIARYRERRAETLRKLVATESDLLRVEDITTEVEKQSRSLKRQASRARTHLKLKEELAAVVCALYGQQVQALRDQEAKGEAALTDYNRKREQMLRGLAQLEAERGRLTSELARSEEHLSEARAQAATLHEAHEDLRSQILISEERRKAQNERLSYLEGNLKEQRSVLPQRRKRTEERSEELTSLLEREREVRDQLAAKYWELIEVEDQVLVRRRRVHQESRQQSELVQLEAGIREQILGLSVRQATLSQQLEELTGEVKEIEEELVQVAEGSRLADEERNRAEQSVERLRDEVREVGDGLDRSTEALARLDKEKSVLLQRLAEQRSEADLLKAHIARREGYEESVKVLLDSEIDGLVGSVAELIQVAPGYERAIEAALAFYLTSVVVTGEKATLEAITYLERSEKGRAGIVLSDGVPVGEVLASANTDGIIGRAIDFVTCNTSSRGIVERLLGKTVIVVDLATGLRLMKSGGYPKVTFVTRGGEVIEPTGVLWVGDGRERGPLVIRHRVAELSDQIVETEALLEAVERKRGRAEREHQEKHNRLVELEKRFREAVDERTAHEITVSKLRYREKSLSEAAEKERRELEELEQTINSLQSDRDASDARMAQFSREREKAERDLRTSQERLREVEERMVNLVRERDELRLELIGLENNRKRLNEELASESVLLGKIEKTIEDLVSQIVSVEDEKRRLEAFMAECQGQLAQLSEQMAALKRDHNELNERRDGVAAQVEKVRDQIEEMRQQLSQVQQEGADIRIAVRETEMARKSLRDRMIAEYGVEIDESASHGEVEASVETVERIRERLRRLGPVNPLAVEEYQEARNRLEYLTGQRADIVEAKLGLEDALVEIDRTATEKFLDTFEKVRENFQDLFQKLFNGGEADLVMDQPDNPLESTIQVIARPPGKRLQRIELLSSGERALVAISLLFAINAVRPSPFCILDEIDAPLDDANVERYISLIEDLAKRSQIVYITHNKRTMEVADCLYGITMEEAGVSKVVSVRLRDDMRS